MEERRNAELLSRKIFHSIFVKVDLFDGTIFYFFNFLILFNAGLFYSSGIAVAADWLHARERVCVLMLRRGAQTVAAIYTLWRLHD